MNLRIPHLSWWSLGLWCACAVWLPTLVATAQEPAKNPFPNRLPAPGLGAGTEWFNTAGPLELRDLRGKFVILDFWTYCCINCMHILPELKKLEHAYPDSIVVIGVHSPKFDGEEDGGNIREAILRYEIEHPVVNDRNRKIWDAYRVNSWPSLRVIDPEGKVVAEHGGEIDFESLDAFFKKALPYYRDKKLLDPAPLHFNTEAYRVRKESPLFFPGKVLAVPAENLLFTADSNHNRIVVSDLDGKVQTLIGAGAAGKADGPFAEATFNKPQGMAYSAGVLYVADCENHLIRAADMQAGTVKTLAGTGVQRRIQTWPGMDPADPQPAPAGGEPRFFGPGLQTPLNSPWALWIHENRLYIAMAGPHQIWVMDLEGKEVGIYAGNGREDIVDGRRIAPFPYQEGYASFAQPSGLASDGKVLFVADSEGSSIRTVPFDPAGRVGTLIGTADLPINRLFVFGDVDGGKREARLQHALGVAYQDGKLYVADTYNNKIKVIDVAKGVLKSLVGDGTGGLQDDPPRFNEPAGLSIAGDRLYVADTNNHAIRVISLAGKPTVRTLSFAGLQAPQTKSTELTAPVPVDPKGRKELPPTAVKTRDGSVAVAVKLNLPKGFKLHPVVPQTWKLELEQGDDAGLRGIAGIGHKILPDKDVLPLSWPTAAADGKATVLLRVQFFYCKDGKDGVCKVGQGQWRIPLEWGPAGTERVDLEVHAE